MGVSNQISMVIYGHQVWPLYCFMILMYSSSSSTTSTTHSSQEDIAQRMVEAEVGMRHEVHDERYLHDIKFGTIKEAHLREIYLQLIHG